MIETKIVKQNANLKDVEASLQDLVETINTALIAEDAKLGVNMNIEDIQLSYNKTTKEVVYWIEYEIARNE